ncbi:bifunctional isocitrate dehydrogenase kinase/phosphatase [Verticiella sediminum]|uniref:Isocitrate dehydrogenase kinase/phosphatase n=1 Tax=Verticiella sediminum TaxID=1247510 RepID=A0A556AL47_9BURK|nr:bifunctional isocitrate dehydrogenase kinase/phosphatase [Verticiella sediminum]TSH93611.1 bifunctional isocitrate dehydrogenase kinase/phosphatase [Verticiella sediminum]
MNLPVTSGDVRTVAPPPPAAPDPRRIAEAILAGFDRHYALFRYCAQRAKTLFENGDWRGIQRLNRDRIEYYDARVRECVARLERAFHAGALPDRVWQQVKQEYLPLLADHLQPECAETFFNSVSCKILRREYFNNDFIFVRPAVAADFLDSARPSYRAYYPRGLGLRRAVTQMLADFGLAAPYEDLPRDVRRLIAAGLREMRLHASPRIGGFQIEPDLQIQVLSTLFFRNKGAYAVGRIINANTIYPFAIPLLRSAAGEIYADTLLFSADDLATLFSFTRAYFLVDMDAPSAYVSFLRTLLPNKPKAELYTMIGLQKQGKTLFYRDFLDHLKHSQDRFVIAPGIKGMVMSVFTLPSYPYVFKVIKDRIAKDGMTRETVKRKYQLVKMHDRIGRMADTWEYSQVALPRERFDEAVIDELKALAPSLLEEHDGTIVIRHVYIERRMTPLNLFLQRASPMQLRHGVREYGNAIRELAAANIFPGDMLFKNFGVTRLGRIVFYDYDEIQPMTEMHFRRIPPAPNEEAEMSSEPWYAIGPNDVFPEEFRHFLLGDPRVREIFLASHAELLDADWWERCRAGAQRGRIEDIFPYDPAKRFAANDALLAPAGGEAGQT